jgi:hypothetical protein
MSIQESTVRPDYSVFRANGKIYSSGNFPLVIISSTSSMLKRLFSEPFTQLGSRPVIEICCISSAVKLL